VLEHTQQYEKLVRELGLRLVLAVDTHTHADHITAIGQLREDIGCRTALGAESGAECVDYHLREGEMLQVDGLRR
jgi:sulfur dioxygenase